eukprot:974390-Pelagomonas_calceolata.AAC.1
MRQCNAQDGPACLGAGHQVADQNRHSMKQSMQSKDCSKQNAEPSKFLYSLVRVGGPGKDALAAPPCLPHLQGLSTIVHLA